MTDNSLISIHGINIGQLANIIIENLILTYFLVMLVLLMMWLGKD